MEKLEIPKFKSEKEPLEKFKDFFPEGKIKEIRFEDLQEKALKFFEGCSRRFISPEDYKPKNFSKLFLVEHDNGDSTYVATQTKRKDDGGAFEEIYLSELRGKEVIGHGDMFKILRADKADEQEDGFIVGYTLTEDEFINSGLGKRRLLLMNALTKTLYGQPLLSGDVFCHPAAVKNCEDLVKEGRAKKITENGKDSYVML